MENVLSVAGLTKRFGGFTVVDDVYFDMKAGEIRSLIGPNGAGKTTFFNCVTGMFRPNGGRVTFKDVDVTNWSAGRRVRAGMARTFQITNIFPGLGVGENVAIPLRSKRGKNFNVFRRADTRGEIASKVEEVLSLVGIEVLIDRRADELSHGDQRALEIAIGLALDPDVLFLDEPTAGMARDETGRISDLVQRLSERMSILLVEHDISMVLSISDRITVMAEGRILAEGSPEEISANPDVEAAYLGGVLSSDSYSSSEGAERTDLPAGQP